MAGTITTRISIDGAEDIRKKLEALGAAGEKAFKQIQDAAKKPIIDPAQIDRSKQAFDQLAVAAQRTGNAIEQAGRQSEAAGQAIGTSLTTAATRFTIAATAIAFAISSITRALTSGAGETAQTITDQADRLALTIPQWIALRRSIEAAGGSAEEFANSVAPLLRNLNQLSVEASGRSIQTFADGTQVAVLTIGKLSQQSKDLLAVLEKFGVRRHIIDRGSVAIMQELARIIDGMPEGTAKATAGIQFFGNKWRDVVADLRVGFKSVGDAEAELDNKRRASRSLTEDQVKAAKAAADQWEDLGKAIRAVKDQIGAFFASSSAARAKWLTDMVDDARMLLQTWLRLNAAGREGFLANLGDSAAETAFKILIAVGQQLAGVWDVLAAAGGKLMRTFDGIAGIFEGITGSQVAAFFITATIAAVGLAVALKGIALVLTPLTALISLVFGPFGPLLLAAAVAAALFWDKLKAGAAAATSLISVELQDIGDSIKKLFAGDFSGFWDQFSQAAVSAFQKIAAALAQTELGKALIQQLDQLKNELPGTIALIGQAFLSILPIATMVAEKINSIFGTNLTGTSVLAIGIIGQMTGAFQLLGTAVGIAGTAIGLLISGLGLLVTAFGVVPVAIGLAVVAVSAFVAALLTIPGFATATWNAVVDAIGAAITAVDQFIAKIASIVWNTISSAGVAAWNAITDAINNAIDAVLRFIGLKPSGGAAGAPAPGFARGGMIGGRGSGTSDSNLAWVSRGEHIMPARAVRQPGVLAFLEALRRSGGDLTRVLDGLGRFATGGLVTMPALAGGGTGSMSHVTIQFPGLPAISGLRASQSVVDELQRAAAMAQVRSGGRKPSRYT
jgi:hypothetical protein